MNKKNPVDKKPRQCRGFEFWAGHAQRATDLLSGLLFGRQLFPDTG